MDLNRKTDIAKQAVNSISRHEDEDASVRKAMLDELVAHVEAEKAAIDQRVRERIEALKKSG